jgi:predicted N-acetyltransferase YhbS
MNLRYELIDEYRIGRELREQIRLLLHECFPEEKFTQTRTYLKQLPQKRMLAFDGNSPVGHIGIEHRVIAIGAAPAQIVGLIEVVVSPNYRQQGVASRMISMILQEYSQGTAEFAMLFATDSRLYEKHGFHRQRNKLTWLKIDEHKNFGLGEEVLPELMIKELTDRKWTGEPVDLLGYQF